MTEESRIATEYRQQLAADIERHGLKGYVLNGHYLGKAQEEIIKSLRSATTSPEVPLCGGHAEAWFCGRNHLPSGFDTCVVCCFEEAWKRMQSASASATPTTSGETPSLAVSFRDIEWSKEDWIDFWHTLEAFQDRVADRHGVRRKK